MFAIFRLFHWLENPALLLRVWLGVTPRYWHLDITVMEEGPWKSQISCVCLFVFWIRKNISIRNGRVLWIPTRSIRTAGLPCIVLTHWQALCCPFQVGGSGPGTFLEHLPAFKGLSPQATDSAKTMLEAKWPLMGPWKLPSCRSGWRASLRQWHPDPTRLSCFQLLSPGEQTCHHSNCSHTITSRCPSNPFSGFFPTDGTY